MSGVGRKPLHAKKILVTRPSHQAAEFSEILRAMGAEPVEFPLIMLKPMMSPALGEFIENLVKAKTAYDFIVFTSRNGVDFFFKLAGNQNASSILKNSSIVAVGPKTANCLEKRGIKPAIIPDKYIAEEVAQALISKGVKDSKILLLKPREARKVLPQLLKAAEAEVTTKSIYETRPAYGREDEFMQILEEVDFVTVTSGSSVKSLHSICFGNDGKSDILPGGAKLASIGPVTSAAARKLGLKVDVEANEFTVIGLAEAMAEYVLTHETYYDKEKQ